MMRLRGLWGPLAAFIPSQGKCLHTILPLQPATTLYPATTSSTNHIPGDICQSTKQPFSRPPLPLRQPPALLLMMLPDPLSVSLHNIFTLPAAYMLFLQCCSFIHPVAAKY